METPICPVCDKPLSSIPCSGLHATAYNMHLRRKKYAKYEDKLKTYMREQEGKEMAHVAVYDENFIGAVYYIDLNSIDWSEDISEQVRANGTKKQSFDSVFGHFPG